MFKRSCVRISALATGWTFFHIDFLLNCNVCLFETTKNKWNRGREWPILQKSIQNIFKVRKNVSLIGTQVVNTLLERRFSVVLIIEQEEHFQSSLILVLFHF